mgnify:CR=1 FL=1
MSLPLQPLVLSSVGDGYTTPCRVGMVLWEGATTSADTVTLNHRAPDGGEEALLWPGRTDSTQTYLGFSFGTDGVHCPYGFRLAAISAGRVLVYLVER